MDISNKQIRALNAIGKVAGAQIQFVEAIEGGAYADYVDGVIRISLKSKDPVRVAMMHEVVHRLREINPEAYGSLADFVCLIV